MLTAPSGVIFRMRAFSPACSSSRNVWFDHDAISDGSDGNLDVNTNPNAHCDTDRNSNSNADTENLRETLRMYKTFLDQLIGSRAS